MTSGRTDDDEAVYEPKRPGFDVEATRRALATVDRARARPGARGEDANAAYVDDGPAEAARRLGTDEKTLGDSIERARRRH